MREQLPIEVELMSLPDTLALLQERLALFTTPDLPPVLTDAEEVWQCDYCPLRSVCEELHGGPVGKNAEA